MPYSHIPTQTKQMKQIKQIRRTHQTKSCACFRFCPKAKYYFNCWKKLTYCCLGGGALPPSARQSSDRSIVFRLRGQCGPAFGYEGRKLWFQVCCLMLAKKCCSLTQRRHQVRCIVLSMVLATRLKPTWLHLNLHYYTRNKCRRRGVCLGACLDAPKRRSPPKTFNEPGNRSGDSCVFWWGGLDSAGTHLEAFIKYRPTSTQMLKG